MNRRLFIGMLGAASGALGMGRLRGRSPKYIFLMIGDGMGDAERRVAEQYARMKYPDRSVPLLINHLPVNGSMTTHEIGGDVTDSAAAGTALACGEKTANGVLGLKADLKTPLRSVAFDARDAGMRVGLVTSVPIDHATPAAFYAQVPQRGMYYEIDEQLPPSGFDYFAGEPMLGRSKAKDRPSPDRLLENGGYRSVKDRAGFDALKAGVRKVVVETGLGYAIDGPQPVTLAELTRKGIELLDSKDGFFMMVEGGKIDWSGHANDLAANIHETLAFDEAVAEAMAFCRRHPEDSLLIVTADHETGGLQFGDAPAGMAAAVDAQKFQGKHYINEAEGWKKGGKVSADEAYRRLVERFGLAGLPADEAAHVRAAVEQTFSNEADDTRAPEIQKMYGKRNAAVISCQHALAARAGARWTTFHHTGVPVPVTAWGTEAERFGGSLDNTDIGLRLKELVLR